MLFVVLFVGSVLIRYVFGADPSDGLFTWTRWAPQLVIAASYVVGRMGW